VIRPSCSGATPFASLEGSNRTDLSSSAKQTCETASHIRYGTQTTQPAPMPYLTCVQWDDASLRLGRYVFTMIKSSRTVSHPGSCIRGPDIRSGGGPGFVVMVPRQRLVSAPLRTVALK